MTETQQTTAQDAGQQAGDSKPPWGDEKDFDPKKAWSLIEGLRADKERLSARETLTDEQKQKLAEYDRISEAAKTDLEKATGELSRWQTEAEKWRSTAVGARIQAIAATDFADPSDAIGELADKNYLDAGGQIDEAGIKRDLAAVLERKPHWRKQEGAAARVPAPNPAQGSGGGRPVNDPGQEFAAILQGQLNGTG